MEGALVVGLIGAFGFGSMATAGFQSLLAGRSRIADRNFVELRDACIGFLTAIAEMDRVIDTESRSLEDSRAQTSLNLALARLQIVAPAGLVELAERWADPTTSGDEMEKILQELLVVIRKELGVATHRRVQQ